MTKFFGKLRRRLLTENKISKYLLYAIGEIILVVIGILIALQVNNKNTERANDVAAFKLMSRIQVESEQNQKEITDKLNEANLLLDSAEDLINMFSHDFAIHNAKTVDSMISRLLVTPSLDYKSSTLDEALSSGIVSLIQSDDLRDQLYQIPNAYDNILYVEKLILDDYKNNLMPYLYDHISLRQVDGTFSALKKRIGQSKLNNTDNRKVLGDVKFESMVDNKMYDLNSLIESYDAFSDLNKHNIALLKEEIERLN